MKCSESLNIGQKDENINAGVNKHVASSYSEISNNFKFCHSQVVASGKFTEVFSLLNCHFITT